MSFNSKYKGQEVEQLLDQISSGNIGGGGQNIYISDGIVPDNENILLWVDESISTDQLDYLTEDDANALYVKKGELPEQVTESTVSGWGFTKNTGTYSKPSSGIPKDDLNDDIKDSLDKADTALQEHQSLEGYARTEDIPIKISDLENDSGFVTTEDIDEEIDDVELSFVTKAELDAAISEAITTTLNTEV